MPIEIWVLCVTWIIGYALIGALLMAEYKVIYQKPILTLATFISDTLRCKNDALANIESATATQALEGFREKYLSKDGLLTKLADKIELLPGEEHPEAGAILQNAIRSVRIFLKEKRESLIPLSDQQVLDRLLDSPHRDLVANIPYLKHLEGNKPIAELQDGLYHKVIYEKKLAEDIDKSEFNNDD